MDNQRKTHIQSRSLSSKGNGGYRDFFTSTKTSEQETKGRQLENGAIGFLIFVIILAVTMALFKLEILLIFLKELI